MQFRFPRLLIGLALFVSIGGLVGTTLRAEEDGAGGSFEDHSCLMCHGVPGEVDESLLVDGHAYQDSIHKDMECSDCHTAMDPDDPYPHPDDPETENCTGCHDDMADELATSVHAGLVQGDDEAKRSESCMACHGVHDVFPASDRRSRLYPLNVPRACGTCHFEQDDAWSLSPADLQKERYTDDTHGHALIQAGLISAPTCVSCHGGHGVRSSEDPASGAHPDHVSEMCGSCHVGILEKYRESVHGLTERGHATENGNGREPATCTDCHAPHGIERAGEHFKLEIIETCSGCHEGQGDTYRGTYHGRVTEIGFAGVASCDDCHTAHSILPSSDPNSSVGANHRMDTCSKCHAGVNANFAAYEVHADPLDRERWPTLYWARRIMRGLVFFTWFLGGVHLLLWLYRATRERKQIRAHLRPLSGRWYRRWPWTYRAIHLTLVISFLLLALTGLPLRFHDAAWSSVIFGMLGGPEATRFLHRAGAVLTFIYAAAFLLQLVVRVVRGERGLFRGPNSMLPRVKDLQDIKGNFRWFFRGGKQPEFDRWTYWEKFDFFAECWGVFFIGTTGLIMWFPTFFTSFLPGSVINLAHILHSYEALLATSFIFTMHFFHANLRPGKFPLDPMFLTGRISEEELRHERPAEYERMRADGRLETDALPPPNERIVGRARVIGGILMSVGLILLVLMASTLFI